MAHDCDCARPIAFLVVLSSLLLWIFWDYWQRYERIADAEANENMKLRGTIEKLEEELREASENQKD